MAPMRDRSPNDDYFNDLSKQPSGANGEGEQRRGSQEDSNQTPKPKRIACVLCRKRKLKCDGNKPACGTCTRLQHDCSYDEVRRKSGPKRGYVKALEARLAQVETLLKTKDDSPEPQDGTATRGNVRTANPPSDTVQAPQFQDDMLPEFSNQTEGTGNSNAFPQADSFLGMAVGYAPTTVPAGNLDATGSGIQNVPLEENFPWEMIGLGLDEPLPLSDVVDELTATFFDKIHPSIPMIHRPRYHAAMNLPPHLRPPVCLRYAMWATAAGIMDKYESLQEHFYLRARKYIQQDEMRGHGEGMITIAHAQTWILLASYEFKMMYFPRAWMSSGRASRMTQMMGLHRLDGTGLDVKQCLPPPKDWTEREERRRTFWMSFCVDRYASIGTGWPMVIEERDILTKLPVDEESFEFSKPQKTKTLNEALDPDGAPSLSSYGGVVLMATLFGRNLTHLHRPGPADNDNDLNGEFWKRHRGIDNILLNSALNLPSQIRLPHGLNDPNVVFLNMNIHTSTICLHQAAIFKADRNRMPASIASESKVRCITAAAEIASIMRMISHLDLSACNPFISFCLYVAARVFVQYLKSRPNDIQVRTSLQFLLTAMHAIKRKNPLTESFLVQLDIDLEGAGLEDSATLRAKMQKPSNPSKTPGCLFRHLGMEALRRGPTYGNQGLAVYTNPDERNVPQAAAGAMHPDTFGRGELGAAGLPHQIPNREQRTPGSMHTLSDSSRHRSPANLNGEMDTSPDGSGNDHNTPSSQQHDSSHTSNTGYSPINGIDQQPKVANAETNIPFNGVFFKPNSTNFNTDFDLNTAPLPTNHQQHEGFVLPQGWNSGENMASGHSGFTPGPSAGFTPAPTGFTPGPNGEVLGMSDQEWDRVFNGLGNWDTSLQLTHDTGLENMLSNARKS